MSLFSLLSSIFKKNSCSKEIEQLNKSCNLLFKDIFNKCRKDFGQELLDVMNIKSSAYTFLSESNSDSNLKENIVKKILSLSEVYFKLAENYSDSLRSLNSKDISNSTDNIITSQKFKLDEIHSLIKSLNLQLSLDSCSSISEENEDLVNEALALNNVLKEKNDGTL